jgi:hypothetical protein
MAVVVLEKEKERSKESSESLLKREQKNTPLTS